MRGQSGILRQRCEGNRGRLYRRRAVLEAAIGAVGVALLAACGGETSPAATATRGTGATVTAGGPGGTVLPTPTTATAGRVPVAMSAAPGTSTGTPPGSPSTTAGVIPSGVVGIPDAYTQPPMPYRAVPGMIGKGGKVTAFTIAFQSPPPPRERNQYWQELERRLGVTWDVTLGPSASYGEKATAFIAGGELPDLFYIYPGQNAQQLWRAIDQGAFTDLTPYVTGDALKEYPNLARLDPQTWANARFKSKLYGVPRPIPRGNNYPLYRGDWAKKLGVASPKNADDLYNLFIGMTKRDPDGNGQADTYAMGSTNGNLENQFAYQLFRTPNNWRANADGTLTKDIETSEFRDAVTFMRRLWEGGAYHPDAPTMTQSQMTDAFAGGKIGLRVAAVRRAFGVTGWRVTTKQTQPAAEVVGLIPPGFDGGKGVTYNTSGFFGYTGIPARVGRDAGRVRELLHVLNYLASPFPSEEYDFLINGIKGVHYTPLPNGGRMVTDKRAEIGDLIYLMATDEVSGFYYPELPGEAEVAQAAVKDVLAIGIEDPTLTLYSPTGVMRASELAQLGKERVNAIITGKEPLSALDTYIRDWRGRGGDTIRKEYEQALKGQ